MFATRSIIFASFGKCSQIWMPVTLVLIGLNSPRISTGAPGFRSTMSWCGGPPERKTMMTDLCELRTPALLSARSNSGNVSPPRPRAPIRRNSRRDRPAQKDACGLPRIDSMAFPRIMPMPNLSHRHRFVALPRAEFQGDGLDAQRRPVRFLRGQLKLPGRLLLDDDSDSQAVPDREIGAGY